MLTQTSVTAIRLLLQLGQVPNQTVTLKEVARQIKVSPTYLVKVAGHLIRADIVQAVRGQRGGVVLRRSPVTISLHDIVVACQGAIKGDYCRSATKRSHTCAFHQAGVELQEAILGVLQRWTLEDFLRQPCPTGSYRGQLPCVLQFRPYKNGKAA